MSNDNNCNVFDVLAVILNSLLDFLLADLVEGRGGLIKQKDLWLLKERSCDSNALLLTTGQLAT